MSDLLKSAFGYFNSSNVSEPENDFVGQIVEIGNVKLVVKKKIAEGGYAFVYLVQDPNTGKEYALKRLLASDAENNANILEEINILKKLSGHPNIIQYLAAASIDKATSSHGKNEYLILTELCSKGNLVEFLNARSSPFPPDVVCKIFWQTCRAVQHMHSQIPPIVHRDLKIENLLISKDCQIKLCDFGSCTLKTYRPDSTWNASQHSSLEEDMAKYTTPMYRAPEMVDTWNNYPIGTPCDIWALGCILYTLCFMSHPFSDSAKLKILNANFSIPASDLKYSSFHEIIRGCLRVNPETRFSVADVLERLAAIGESNGYNLNEHLNLEGKDVHSNHANPSPVLGSASQTDSAKPNRPCRPPPPSAAAIFTTPQHSETPKDSTNAWHKETPSLRQEATSQMRNQTGKHETGLLSTIKGGAGSFLKNLKDTSNKVMQTVQQSIARWDLDISYICSRVIVMPFPADGIESAYKSNHIEDVRAFLEARHPGGRYCVYNLSGRSYPATRFSTGRVVDCSFGGFRKVPPLHVLYSLCADVFNFLDRNSKNVAVVHCTDGKASSAVFVCCLLMFCGILERFEDAIQMFAVKRCPPDLHPSETRYLQYFSRIVGNPPVIPHSQPITLVSVLMQPVPLFTKLRDGCRPYVEVYQGDEKVKCTRTDYDRMQVFHISEGKVVIPLNITVCGDITVAVFHARQNLGGVLSSSKPTGHKICQLQFHTGFVHEEDTSLKFTKHELDNIGEPDHYQERFITSVNIFVCDYSKELRTMPWESPRNANPLLLFANSLEMDETVEAFVTKPGKKPDSPSAAPPPPPPPASSSQSKLQQQAERENESSEESANVDSVNTSSKANRQESVDLLGLGLDENVADGNDVPRTNDVKRNDATNTLSELNDIFQAETKSDLMNVGNEQKSEAAFDPFGSGNASAAGSQGIFSLDNWPNFAHCSIPLNPSGLTRNSSTPNLEKERDPFAEFGDLVAGLNIPTSASKPVTPIIGSPNVQSPTHRPPVQTIFGASQSSQASQLSKSAAGNFAKSPMESRAPDYSRSHFDSAFGKKTGVERGGKGNADVFGDLLGSQGYDFASKKESGPRTMNELRKEDLVKELDPDRMKIFEWTEGKKGNIRALLCSIHLVLWESCKWKGVDMSQLVSASDVKKAYRKACLAVHPDKQMGTEYENIAKLIFVELNNAWTDFENDSSQQALFST